MIAGLFCFACEQMAGIYEFNGQPDRAKAVRADAAGHLVAWLEWRVVTARVRREEQPGRLTGMRRREDYHRKARGQYSAESESKAARAGGA